MISLERALFLLPGLVIGLTFHEAAHALSAHWLGDSYAKSLGRVSLNPLRHLSLIGTMAVFILGFGWGKPVPVNALNFRYPRLYHMLTSLAGPAANILLALLALAALHAGPPWPWLWMALLSVYLVNVILAFINLLPIPPLDGSSIWPCLFPALKPAMTGRGTMIWFLAIFFIFRSGAIDPIIGPLIVFVLGLLPS